MATREYGPDGLPTATFLDNWAGAIDNWRVGLDEFRGVLQRLLDAGYPADHPLVTEMQELVDAWSQSIADGEAGRHETFAAGYLRRRAALEQVLTDMDPSCDYG
ncbi:hypothetical protein GB931_00355 [Modestobacter sp. I12A-02628]|nr:hypothetical protein [Goekera deserti]